jgi:hypothetical protein
MPVSAHATEPKSAAADSSPADGSWYSAFTAATDAADARPGASTSPSHSVSPDPLESLMPSDIPGPHRRLDGDGLTLPALLSLQHAELDRLIHDNERLMDRIETLLQIQSREQVLRQQLQNQVDRIGEQIDLATPRQTLEAVRREARAGVTEEIKPVLMAILDALERFASKAAAPAPAAQTAVPPDPFLGEDYGKLPAILTRPLSELMDVRNQSARANDEAASRRPRKSPFRNRKRSRPPVAAERESADGPGLFAWTTVLPS